MTNVDIWEMIAVSEYRQNPIPPSPPTNNPPIASQDGAPPTPPLLNSGVEWTQDKPVFGDSQGYTNEYGYTFSWSTRTNQNKFQTLWLDGTDGSYGMEYMLGPSSIFFGSKEVGLSVAPTLLLQSENTFLFSAGYSIDLGVDWADKKGLVIQLTIRSITLAAENDYSATEFSSGVYMRSNITKGISLGANLAALVLFGANLKRIPVPQFRTSPGEIGIPLY
jgi:hypothetical protein